MSAGDDLDTDILIAMLCSLLPQPYPATSVLLDALVESKGDVQAAATILSASARPATRKRVNRLDDWLQSDSGPSKVAKLDNSMLRTTKEEQAQTSTEMVFTSGTNALTPRSPASSSRTKRSAFDVLKDKSPSKSTAPVRLAPLLLATPALVEQHVPCTMHLDILPPDLACRLFYAMVDEAAGWERNSWWLFDRLVESPHKTSFWVRMQDRNQGDISYEQASNMWYNGRKMEPPKNFLPVMEEACEIIERIVSEQLEIRERYALEWGGPCHGPPGTKWRANVAASNCYTGRNESVGFHSDILSYLGPYTTIASLSLGTTRLFRLREVIPKEEANQRAAQTFNIPLSHNSLTIMHATCQEYFKHSVPPQAALDVFRPPFPPHPSASCEPSNIRINLTFRFYRPDFHPSTIPRCKCGVPMILRPDMKGRPRKGEERRREIKYWWTCYSGAQSEKEGCGLWQVFDPKAEGRGPFVGELVSTAAATTVNAATPAEE